MKDCYVCGRKDTKYSCILCESTVCNVCADLADEDEDGYDERIYRVGKCPDSKCPDSEKVSASKKSGNEGKDQNLHPFFKSRSRKRKTDSNNPAKNENASQNKLKKNDDGHAKRAKVGEDDESQAVSNTSETMLPVAKEQKNKESSLSNPIIDQPESERGSSELTGRKNEIFQLFKKVFHDIEEDQIHNYHFCTERKCNEISSNDLKNANSDNKFQHKWLFDPKIARCEETHEWCLVYIDGKGMFCSLCREYDIKQNNGVKTWNSVANVRCRTQTVRDHFQKPTSMHQEAVQSLKRHKTSYFDKEQVKTVNSLKNEVYYKVFHSLYWLAKEEIASVKCKSLLTLLEKMGVEELKYFETRSEPVLRKMLLLIAKNIISDIVEKIKQSDAYGLLTDEVTDISNLCQLVSFIKIFDSNKGKADTVFIDCSDVLECSADASADADAIVTCITERFEKLGIEIKRLKAFVSDGASVMIGKKGGVAAKLKNEFTSTMINIHCICHRLALACGDTGDDYKFINSFEETMIELWSFFKNSSKRLKIYIRIALNCKEFSSMSKKRQKKTVKTVKKACRTRWLSLDAGVDGVFDEYAGLVKTMEEIIKTERGKSGAKATGLLKKIMKPDFIGTLYLLKHMLPLLSTLSKSFQANSLNFSRIIPAINKCKTKIKEIERSGKVWKNLENDLESRLKPLSITFTDFQKDRIKSLVLKYSTAICINIDGRFPPESCKVLSAFSIFDVDLLPEQSTPEFTVYGTDEISCLGTQFFPESKDSLLEQWKDFRFEMTEMKKKLSALKSQLQTNKLKFKKTSTEWTLEHILNRYKNEDDFQKVVELAKIANIVPVTNAWPERGASAVKRIKTRQRNTMKNDLLNALLHISLNGPLVNSPEAACLIDRVTEQYSEQNHRRVPKIYTGRKVGSTTSTQTEVVEFDDSVEEFEIIIKEMGEQGKDFLPSNMDCDNDSSSSDDEDEEVENV